MIDQVALQKAYETDGIYALQLEVGDRCLQDCVYCYMNALQDERNTLTDEHIKHILHDSHALGITAIEWLGGEPLLRSSIFDHMALAADLGFRNNIWTGGLPLQDPKILNNSALYTRRGLIAVHISTVNPELYQTLHPHRSSDDLTVILEAVNALLDLGYPAAQILNSVTFTGLQSAADMIETIEYFESHFGIKTSLNVYHTYVRPDAPIEELSKYIPVASEIARVYERYTRQWGVAKLPMNCVNKQYCSATVAVLCDGHVTPCATIRDDQAPTIHDQPSLRQIVAKHRDMLILKKFKRLENRPAECQVCDLAKDCWGCRSRAYAAGLSLFGKDPRCFRSETIPG